MFFSGEDASLVWEKALIRSAPGTGRQNHVSVRAHQAPAYAAHWYLGRLGPASRLELVVLFDASKFERDSKEHADKAESGTRRRWLARHFRIASANLQPGNLELQFA